jgi:hypothetical protein
VVAPLGAMETPLPPLGVAAAPLPPLGAVEAPLLPLAPLPLPLLEAAPAMAASVLIIVLPQLERAISPLLLISYKISINKNENIIY